MNREEAKELLPIIQAFAEGRVIEQKIRGLENWKEPENDLDLLGCDKFRIKPEPKYRPFKSQEECWQEMHKHPNFGWLYNKDKGYYVNIAVMGDSVGMNGQKFDEAYNSYTFTDGKPFAIKEE